MRVVWPIKKSRIDAGFLDPNYPEWRRRNGMAPAEHTGVDLNVIGTSGDGDLGYPVVAAMDGVVVHAALHRVWGNIVVVRHDYAAQVLGLPYLASQYAHLHQVCVQEGDEVWAGEPVGSVGKGANGAFMAHLHFELRKADIPADTWPGMNKSYIQQNYLDPAEFFKRNLAEERRFRRDGLVLYLPEGSRSYSGTVIVNLEDAHLAQVGLKQ